jgi:hypothetical protein
MLMAPLRLALLAVFVLPGLAGRAAEPKVDPSEIETELKAEIVELKKLVHQLEERHKKVVAKLSPIDLLAIDRPKGKVAILDRDEAVVYVNLGSADGVKPTLTFSVYAADEGGGKRGDERKAAIAIIKVMDTHLSMARVTERAGPKQALIVGDQLYNPAFDPNYKIHVAVAGIVPFRDGGPDRAADFIRALEADNVILDAILKKDEMAIEGEVTPRTDYLILGDMPVDGEGEVPARFARELQKLREDAGRCGATIVPFRRFIRLIGYQPPKEAEPKK